jgi:1-acyl-sn-glycerol-3-phosphate acyltransferase
MRHRPNPMPWTYRWRTYLIHAPLMAVITIACGSLSLLVSLVDKRGNLQHRIARVWARGCVWAFGSKLTVLGTENLRKHPTAVYASNHTSYMDTPVIFAALPFQFRILARKELWPIPFIGWYLNRSGQIPINTANPRASLASLGAGAKALRAGMALFVFPEGGRTADGELKPFLSGAAYLADRDCGDELAAERGVDGAAAGGNRGSA